jgi:hypothetical protein
MAEGLAGDHEVSVDKRLIVVGYWLMVIGESQITRASFSPITSHCRRRRRAALVADNLAAACDGDLICVEAAVNFAAA